MGQIRKHGRFLWIDYFVGGKRRYENTRTNDRLAAAELLSQREAAREYGPPTKRAPVLPGVYFLRSRHTKLVKVGMSANVTKRVGGLVEGLPGKCDLVSLITTSRYREAETALHQFLHSKHSHGEWFDLTNGDIEAAIRYWATAVLEVKPDA